MKRAVYIEREIDKDKYNTIRDILRQEMDIMDKFKMIICTRCVHGDDKKFNDCKICRCIDGSIKCTEFIPTEIDSAKGIDEERLDKAINSIANKNRELASFLRG